MAFRRIGLCAVLLVLWTALSAQTLPWELDGISVGEALQVMRERSGRSFVYEAHDLDLTRTVHIHAQSLREAVAQLLDGQELSFVESGNSIILYRPAPQAADTESPLEGRILDELGQGVSGALVLDPAHSKGALSEPDGFFSIEVPPGTLLRISCSGFRSAELPAGEHMLVVLRYSSPLLDEAVVIGYGEQNKLNLTGAISTLSGTELSRRTSPTVSHMMQGTVPGLYVQTFSGNPTDVPALTIRGYPSLNGGSPLVIVDGAEGELSKVNPADVASISIIKDASSSAIYGAKAAFGVILVQTKSGTLTPGHPQVRYSGQGGISLPTSRTDFETRGYDAVYLSDLFMKASTGRNYTFYTDKDMDALYARRNDRTEQPGRPWILTEERNGRESYVYYCNTDWYHSMYRDVNPLFRHNISITGRSEGVRYYFSAGIEHKEGTFQVRSEQYNRYSVLGKTDFQLPGHLTFSNRTSFYTSSYDYPGNRAPDYTFGYSAVHGLASFPLQNPDGTWVYKTLFNSFNLANGCHIELGEDAKTNTTNLYTFSDKAELSFRPLEGLDIRGSMTYTLDSERGCYRWAGMDYSLYPREIVHEETGRFMNRLEDFINLRIYRDYSLWGSFSRTLRQFHHLRLTAGLNAQRSSYKNHYTYANNIGSDTVSDYNLKQSDADGNYLMDILGGQGEQATAGVFGRFNYDFRERYLLELSWRYDGASVFGEGYRWGFFPSVSGGWRFSDEPFFRWAKPFLTEGKIRLSAGTLGNQQVAPFQYIRTVSTYTLPYLFDNESNLPVGAKLSSPNAADLSWETTRHWDLGADLAFLENRLQAGLDLYIRDTRNMLTEGRNLPSVYGTSSPLMNGADLRSKGFELTLGWSDTFFLGGKPLHYSLGASLTDYTTRITRFNNEARVLGSHYVGETIGEIWGFVVDGLFVSDEEARTYTDYASGGIDQSYLAGGLTGGWRGGDLRFKDLDGDRIISRGGYTVDNPGDMKVIGNSLPRYQYGGTFTLSWNGFDVSVLLQGVGRMHWYPGADNMAFWGPYSRPYSTYYQKDFLERCWNESRTDAYFPRPRGGIALEGTTYLSEVNDRYLQNIGYCRLKNLTVGYTLPPARTRRLPLSSVRVYLTGENLACLSALDRATNGYLDPEASSVWGPNGFLYPRQRTLMLGLDLVF